MAHPLLPAGQLQLEQFVAEFLLRGGFAPVPRVLTRPRGGRVGGAGGAEFARGQQLFLRVQDCAQYVHGRGGRC